MSQSIKRPTSVLVEHSESREFGNQQNLTFAEFERIAVRVAFSQAGRGYCKTRILVTFDNDDTHQCRLDLGPSDCLNFQDHIEQMIAWSKTDKGMAYICHHNEQVLMEHVAAMYFDSDGNLPTLRAALMQADREAKEAGYLAEAEKQRKDEETAARQLTADIARLQADPGLSHLAQYNGQFVSKNTLVNIRADLKKHFPGVKFSVRLSGRLDMASIIWTDGPTENQVQEITHRYECDGAWRWVFGKIGSLFLSRDLSDALRAEALQQFNQQHSTTYSLDDVRTHHYQHAGQSVLCHVLTLASQLKQTPDGQIVHEESDTKKRLYIEGHNAK